MAVDVRQQRDRLLAAEAEVFAHYGIEVTSRRLALEELGGMSVRVVTAGEGPATVLLHGASMAAPVWAPLLPHLPGRTLHLVELPGCGLTDPIDLGGQDYPSHQVAFVAGVLDALGLDRAPVVGTSLGGWYALRFAVEQPERVTALALVSAPAMALPGARLPVLMAALGNPAIGRLVDAVTPAPSASMTRRMLASIGGGGIDGVPDAMFDALGAAMGLSRAPTLSAAPAIYRGRTALPHVVVSEEELAGCPVPVLLIWGDRDSVQPAEAGVRAAELLPRGRIEVLPGGHGIWFEHPERCGALLTDFLAGVAGAV